MSVAEHTIALASACGGLIIILLFFGIRLCVVSRNLARRLYLQQCTEGVLSLNTKRANSISGYEVPQVIPGARIQDNSNNLQLKVDSSNQSAHETRSSRPTPRIASIQYDTVESIGISADAHIYTDVTHGNLGD